MREYCWIASFDLHRRSASVPGMARFRWRSWPRCDNWIQYRKFRFSLPNGSSESAWSGQLQLLGSFEKCAPSFDGSNCYAEIVLSRRQDRSKKYPLLFKGLWSTGFQGNPAPWSAPDGYPPIHAARAQTTKLYSEFSLCTVFGGAEGRCAPLGYHRIIQRHPRVAPSIGGVLLEGMHQRIYSRFDNLTIMLGRTHICRRDCWISLCASSTTQKWRV